MTDRGFCQCGCGERTAIALVTDRYHGWVRGEPKRFIAGHNNALRRTGHVEEDRGYLTPCWVWQGGLNAKGYGRAWGGMAHRVYYKRQYGPIPAGLTLDHLCRVRACVNPDHLEPVTLGENIRRGVRARRDLAEGYGQVAEPRRFDDVTPARAA